jgi:hypothetical protein
MQIKLFAVLILTSLAQVKKERRPIPPPPPAARVVNVGVRIRDTAEIRSISIAPPAPPAMADEDGEQEPAQPVMRLNLRTAVLQRENFDRWLFADERSESERWRHLDDILQAKVEAVGREHKLTDPQRAKLRLAGRGDIKRFFDRVEDARIAFEVERQSFRTGHPALLRLEPLSQIYQEGAFGDGSLFAKTLRRIEDDQKAGH